MASGSRPTGYSSTIKNSGGLLPPSARGGPKKSAQPASITNVAEETKATNSVVADNPWGLDESQYYIELGGVSKFLQFRN